MSWEREERVASMAVSFSLVDLEEEESERERVGSLVELRLWLEKPVEERNLFWRGLMSRADWESSAWS